MTIASFPDKVIADFAETTEAELYYACESGAPVSTKEGLGIAAARIGGGVGVSMREDPTGFWSKALGFGVTEPVTVPLLHEVIAFYRAAGTPSAVVQIAPGALPEGWPSIAAALGLTDGGSWWKLAAPMDRVRTRGVTPLRVARVGPEDADEWARVVLRGFDMPEVLVPMLAAFVEHPDFTPFAAWDGAEIVAGANLFVRERIASLNSGSTLPSHRGRGAQSALIAARIRAARLAGCDWVIAETGRPRPRSVNPSLANLERAGLRPVYARQNWRWTDHQARSPAAIPASQA